MIVKSRLTCQICTDKPAHLIQTKGNHLLSAHRAKFVFRLLLFHFQILLHCSFFYLFCYRHARDRHIQRQDAVKAGCKRNLYRASDLPRVRSCGHNCPKCTHIIKQLTCFPAPCVNSLFFFRAVLKTRLPFGPCDMAVNIRRLLDDNIHAVLIVISQIYIVSYAAFCRHV